MMTMKTKQQIREELLNKERQKRYERLESITKRYGLGHDAELAEVVDRKIKQSRFKSLYRLRLKADFLCKLLRDAVTNCRQTNR